MATGNGYFVHDQSVMDYAYRLVREYEHHEREQEKSNKYVSLGPKKISRPGGVIKRGKKHVDA